jgi:hypothetical protein
VVGQKTHLETADDRTNDEPLVTDPGAGHVRDSAVGAGRLRRRVPLSVFIGGGNVLFLVFAVLLFAAVGWSFAASVTKLRQE